MTQLDYLNHKRTLNFITRTADFNRYCLVEQKALTREVEFTIEENHRDADCSLKSLFAKQIKAVPQNSDDVDDDQNCPKGTSLHLEILGLILRNTLSLAIFYLDHVNKSEKC